MRAETEKNQADVEKTRIRYFYSKLMSYNSLRKSLKSGVTKKELMVIKDFACNCNKHKDLLMRALVTEEKDAIMHNKCEFAAKTKGIITVNSKGKILSEGYKFYSTHPDWKVRVATTIGLGKFTDENVIEILTSMLNDKHRSVKLAVIQALEVLKLESAKKILQEMSDKNSKKRLDELASRAIKRSKFGINIDKINKYTFYKLLSSGQARKIYHRKSKTNKILVSKQIFQGFLNKPFVEKYFNHHDASYGDYKHPFFTEFNQQNIPVKEHRFTKKNTKRSKINYITHLFYNKTLSINHFENTLNPITGEIYWAITDNNDPKVTRPLLIVKAVKQKPDEFLTIPLTSDITSQSDPGMLIEIHGKKSKLQISRQRIVHRSSLLNKYGNIPRAILKKIQNVNKHKATEPKQSFFYNSGNSFLEAPDNNHETTKKLM